MKNLVIAGVSPMKHATLQGRHYKWVARLFTNLPQSVEYLLWQQTSLVWALVFHFMGNMGTLRFE